MKKILGTTLAAALLFPPGQASAEILKNLKVSGQLDVQTTAARNTSDFSTRGDIDGNGGVLSTGNDRIGAAVTRLLVDAKWDLLDDVHSMVTLRKNSRAWGSAGGVGLGQGGAGSESIGSRNAGNTTNGVIGNLWVDRAAVTIDKLAGHFDTTLGRQYYGEAGDLIIAYGPKDNYGLFVTAIDAARFEAANDWVAFSGLAGKTAGGTLAPATSDTNVRGFDLLWKGLPLKVHTFMWNQVTQGAAAGQLGTTAGKNDNLWVYGVKLRGEAMGGWINADLAANSGESRSFVSPGAGCTALGCNNPSANYMGKALLLDAGYNAEMSGVGALTPWLNFGWGTGRSSNLEGHDEGFQSIATDYRPGIINRRFTQGASGLGGGGSAPAIGSAGLTNRVVYGAGLNFTPAAWEKLTLGTQIWSYNLQRVTQTNVAVAATAERGAKHLGTEFGLTADWKHSENVKVGVGGGWYLPGGVVTQAIGTANVAGVSLGNNPATLAFADFSVKF